jgi:hypothetical protein
MIESNEQLEQSILALANLEKALKALKDRVYSQNPALYAALAQDYRKGILDIRDSIDRYVGAYEARSEDAELWYSLEGREEDGVSVREISTYILAEWLHRMRGAVLRAADYLEEGASRIAGRPKAAVAEMCDFRIVEFKPGSLSVGLKLPGPRQGELFPAVDGGKATAAHIGLNRILRLARWVDSNESLSMLGEITEEDEERKILARGVLGLIPGEISRVKTVKLEGRAVPQGQAITLTKKLRPRVQSIISDKAKEIDVVYEGNLREIDVDIPRFIIRKEGQPDIRCIMPPNLVEDALAAVKKNVRIKGKSRTDEPTKVRIIEMIPLDEPEIK